MKNKLKQDSKRKDRAKHYCKIHSMYYYEHCVYCDIYQKRLAI
jgi:hypothetical protein